VVINELVCEGCGDCGVQSNCLSVEPLETEFGRKRRINQSTCNKDYSCVKGFCPSFVTVEGGQLKKPKAKSKGDLRAGRAARAGAAGGRAGLGHRGGGRGRHRRHHHRPAAGHGRAPGRQGRRHAGRGGLAQKGGATWSHIQIANAGRPSAPPRSTPPRPTWSSAATPSSAANKETLAAHAPGRTFVALNTHGTPTAAFVKNANWQFPSTQCERRHHPRRGRGRLGSFDAEQVATQLLGDSIYTNPLMLGYAWQKGRVPLTRESLMRAMELNGVQVENNKAAFEWGRRCAHDLAAVQALFQAAQVIEFVKKRLGGRAWSRARGVPHRLPGRRLRRQYQAFVEKVQRGRRPAGQAPPDRGGGALPVQADGLQGRVRGGAPAHRPGLHRQDRRACSRATTSWCTTWRRP
jgi:indolepyruvate ferredoxin oxidoreductase